jgi:predicted dinucleotide-binding enzyme
MKRIAILGTGVVGDALSAGFLKYGYEVVRGSRDPGKLAEWVAEAGDAASAATFEGAATQGDAVVLAVKGTAAEEVARACSDGLAGKVVMDATNPIADAHPEDGVLHYFTDHHRSLMERLQDIAPEARFVKVFSCVASGNMVDPDIGGHVPTMFICGNDEIAKDAVTGILHQFGWEWEDMGTAKAARAIEPLAMLFCIPGFREDRWTHAFKLLKMG